MPVRPDNNRTDNNGRTYTASRARTQYHRDQKCRNERLGAKLLPIGKSLANRTDEKRRPKWRYALTHALAENKKYSHSKCNTMGRSENPVHPAIRKQRRCEAI